MSADLEEFTFTPKYGIIDYSKHIWLVDKPHAEKPCPQPGTIYGAEQKKNEKHILTMGSKGMWMIDEVTPKTNNWSDTSSLTYFVDNFLNVYKQINHWTANGSNPPFKTCPHQISDHECSTECENYGCCQYSEYVGYKCLTSPMPDQVIEKIKSGEWGDATRPRVLRQYVEMYMKNMTLRHTLEVAVPDLKADIEEQDIKHMSLHIEIAFLKKDLTKRTDELISSNEAIADLRADISTKEATIVYLQSDRKNLEEALGFVKEENETLRNKSWF